jgi:hypothetical protein
MDDIRRRWPASEQTIRESLADYPAWMAEECIAWTRSHEALGHAFTDGTAAAWHWLNEQQRGPR